MRPIEFRVWDKNLKKMFHEVQVTDYIDEFDCFMDFGDWFKSPESWVVMQFTGLKDKKDKKIYESDIVRYENDYLYVVHWDDINSCWCLVQLIDEGAYTGGISGQGIWRCEVIGNIYKNKELLKRRKSTKNA